MKRIITGIQPSGTITIGNYIGAIKQMVKLQDDYESFVFLADLHTITVGQDPKEFNKKIKELIALYIACGIDPKKNTIFLQSDNLYHTNVSWLLECNTPYGELTRMTQFKDKSSKNLSFSAGLLTYPVLMAADILIYDVDYVPVGADQKQHVEITRNIAQKFNNKYGDVFKVPDVMLSKTGTKIMNLVDPTKKMSKSDENPKTYISMLDDVNVIRKKIMSATTDSECIVKFDMENKPGISNLMNIVTSLNGLPYKEIEDMFEGKQYGEFKKYVADVIVDEISKIQERYNELINSDELRNILDEGVKVTNEIAENKLNKMKEVMGFWN